MIDKDRYHQALSSLIIYHDGPNGTLYESIINEYVTDLETRLRKAVLELESQKKATPYIKPDLEN